jgi:uncharacterized ferritin-like protein (DUF455 family)
MNKLFEMAEACLFGPDIAQKLQITHQAKTLLDQGELVVEHSSAVRPICEVAFPNRPVLLAPREMPRRNLGSAEGIAAFFHAIAHIEFMAIYLAWDLLYRFRHLPGQFYQDWLKVADEEALHFQLICQHLSTMGVIYGDLPAHAGLWDHAVVTADDVLARLALIPRCMEARGLDVTPGIIAKFRAQGNEASVTLLERILTDEVGHVAFGSDWFNRLCREQSLEPQKHYKALIGKYYQGGKPKGPFNREKRKIAGFTDAELDWLEAG